MRKNIEIENRDSPPNHLFPGEDGLLGGSGGAQSVVSADDGQNEHEHQQNAADQVTVEGLPDGLLMSERESLGLTRG